MGHSRCVQGKASTNTGINYESRGCNSFDIERVQTQHHLLPSIGNRGVGTYRGCVPDRV